MSREHRHIFRDIRDHDCAITGFGRHDRVVAFHPDSEGLYCRIDHVWNLGTPSTSEILSAAKWMCGPTGKWILLKVVPHANGKSTDYHFVKPPKVKP